MQNCPSALFRAIHMTLLLAGCDASDPDDEPQVPVVSAWNEIAYEIAYAEDSFFTFKGHRAFSMMHLAMHDVLNTIEPRYTRYACAAAQTDAEPTAAVAQAAYEVLVTQYPDRRSTLDSALVRWLDLVPTDADKARAFGVGRACASAILALREDDGWDFAGSYAFADAPGGTRRRGCGTASCSSRASATPVPSPSRRRTSSVPCLHLT